MKLSDELERYRLRDGDYGSDPGDPFGAFKMPGPCGTDLMIIADDGQSGLGVDWEHVSVSTKKRCPNWKEMCFVKDLFWDAEETAMQLHPPRSRWINVHSYCLHLWRPLKQSIPLPPEIAV